LFGHLQTASKAILKKQERGTIATSRNDIGLQRPRQLPKHFWSWEGMHVVILSATAKSRHAEKQFQWSSASHSE
jgi:hypothetical protein